MIRFLRQSALLQHYIQIIPLRLGLLIAPWCFVWVIAIGCSRQDSQADRTAADHQQPEGVPGLRTGQTERDGSRKLAMEERYSTVSQSHANPIKHRIALAEFYSEWGAIDGQAAVEHSLAQNRTLVRCAFAGWLEADASEPRTWVLSQPDSRRRLSVLAIGLLHALSVTDHADRAEWAAEFAGEPFGKRMVSEVAIGWAKDRPQGALEWLASLPEGEARTGGIEAVFRRWTETDPELASAHLTRMPPSRAKDVAIGSLAKAIYGDDPEVARLWADTIADEKLRELTNGNLHNLTASGSAPARPREF